MQAINSALSQCEGGGDIEFDIANCNGMVCTHYPDAELFVAENKSTVFRVWFGAKYFYFLRRPNGSLPVYQKATERGNMQSWEGAGLGVSTQSVNPTQSVSGSISLSFVMFTSVFTSYYCISCSYCESFGI